ncbi:hypothetical protein AAVH_12456 [Aphelenchoides avenae]|nr:hypothetical protein AAVH_12456 [Aphelenchus avenae]
MFFLTALVAGLNLGPCQVFLTMGISAITFFNPLTTMYFMRSYRDAILAIFGIRKARSVVGPMETRVTGLSVAPTTPATEATQST